MRPKLGWLLCVCSGFAADDSRSFFVEFKLMLAFCVMNIAASESRGLKTRLFMFESVCFDDKLKC